MPKCALVAHLGLPARPILALGSGLEPGTHDCEGVEGAAVGTPSKAQPPGNGTSAGCKAARRLQNRAVGLGAGSTSAKAS
jgi:hypothetical protein